MRAALCVLLLGPALSAESAVAAPDRPDDPPANIVLMLIDNVGYGDLGCYGNLEVLTPRIDRLALEGARCNDFATASPSCSPSRAAILTGRHPLRNGLTDQLTSEQNAGLGLRKSERLLPGDLKGDGYATACFGKWNIGFAPGTRPTDRGFDEFFGHASGNMDYYTHVYDGRHDLYRGNSPAPASGYSTDLFADAACRFIRRHAGGPFFCYVPFNAAHFPSSRNKGPGQPNIWQAPPEALARYNLPPDEPDPARRYRGVLTALDDAVGRILDQIDASGIAERTLVILLSDNGAFMIPDRGLEVASNAPFRDGGVTLYEGGLRVPCLVRWPGQIPAGTTCDAPLSTLDLLPLCLRAAGLPLPSDRVIDGRDPLDALAGRGPSPHDLLYYTWRDEAAVRRGPLKAHRLGPEAPWQLFDLDLDPSETDDLADDRPEALAELSAAFDRWSAQFDPEGTDPTAP